MAHEQQQPMSDARLAELKAKNQVKTTLVGGHYWRNQVTANDVDELLADNERLRAREAALVEVVRAVANGHLLCTCGMTFYPERPPSYSSATFIVSSDIRHRADCPIMKARALLASESADEAK